MSKYKLEYIAIRDFSGNLQVEDFSEPVLLNYEFEDYNEADRMRCELCSKFNYGYVRVIEL